MSHPTWVRGLKHHRLVHGAVLVLVAPYVGAWIETYCEEVQVTEFHSRTLRGCVD